MNKKNQRMRAEEEGEEEDGDGGDSRTSKTKTDQRKDEAKRLFLDIKKGASLETISKKYHHLWKKYNAAVMKLWNNVHGNNSSSEMSKQAKKQRKLEKEKKEDPDYKPGDSEWGIDDDDGNDGEAEEEESDNKESSAGDEGAGPVCKCDIENDKGKTLKAPAVKRETKSDANGNQGRLFWC
jgi:hypothetical protein